MKNKLKYWSVGIVLGVLTGGGVVYGKTTILNRFESLKIENGLNQNCKYLGDIIFESGHHQADELSYIASNKKITYDLTVSPTDFIQPVAGYANVGWVPDVIRSNVNTQTLPRETMPAALNYTLTAGLPSDGFKSNPPAELSRFSNSEYSRDKVISGPLFASILALIGIVAVSRRNVS